MLFVGASDGHLYAFAGRTESLAGVDGQGPGDTMISFASPQPNPFGHSCLFSFTLGKPATLSLKVFDVRGHRVRRIVDETLTEGTHRFEWHGLDDNNHPVSAGVYFAVIKSEDFRQVRKVVYTK